MKLLRLPQVKAKTRKSTAGIYADMQVDLFPKHFKIGSRAVAWLDHEIDEYIVARAKGATQLEIKRLVKELQDRREKITPSPWDEVRNPETSRLAVESEYA